MSPEEERFEEQRSGMGRWLLLAVGLSATALVLISLLTMDEEIIHTLSNLSVPWLLLAVGLTVSRWVWAALRIRALSAPSGVAIPFQDLLKVVFAGNFAGVISPMRAGGVITETYFLYRYGLEPGVSAAVIAFGMAVSTVLLLLSMPLALWLGANRINLNIAFRGLLYVAVAACLVFAVAVLAAMRRPERTLAEAFRLAFPRLSRRPRLMAWVERLSREAGCFAGYLRRIAAEGPRAPLLAALYAALFWGSNLLTMPVIMVALGHPEYFVRSLVAQLVVVTLMPFIPLPGGSGMAEPGFYAVYSSFLQPYLAGLLTLIWRFLDFYLGLLIGGSAFLLVLRDLRHMPGGGRRAEDRDELD